MSSAQQYMRELPSHSSQDHSASKHYKQNLQQTTGNGINNHWIRFFRRRITVSV